MTPQMAARSALSDKLDASRSAKVRVHTGSCDCASHTCCSMGEGGGCGDILGAKVSKVTQNSTTQITE